MKILDWSVVAVGVVLLWTGVFDLRDADTPPDVRRMTLVLSVPPLASALPRLLGAPHPVVLACDAMAVAAGIAAVVIAVRAARRTRPM